MRCYYCGNDIKDDSNTCPYCDKTITYADEEPSVVGDQNDKVFSLEDWRKQREQEKQDRVQDDQEDLEKRVSVKKQQMEAHRREMGFDQVEMDAKAKRLAKVTEHVINSQKPDLDELIRILAVDKKKEVRAKQAAEREREES